MRIDSYDDIKSLVLRDFSAIRAACKTYQEVTGNVVTARHLVDSEELVFRLLRSFQNCRKRGLSAKETEEILEREYSLVLLEVVQLLHRSIESELNDGKHLYERYKKEVLPRMGQYALLYGEMKDPEVRTGLEKAAIEWSNATKSEIKNTLEEPWEGYIKHLQSVVASYQSVNSKIAQTVSLIEKYKDDKSRVQIGKYGLIAAIIFGLVGIADDAVRNATTAVDWAREQVVSWLGLEP